MRDENFGGIIDVDESELTFPTGRASKRQRKGKLNPFLSRETVYPQFVNWPARKYVICSIVARECFF